MLISSCLIQSWQQSAIVSYALNGAENLTPYNWVYLVGIPQEDPMLYKLDPTSPTSWYTTELPEEDDGKVYISNWAITLTERSFRCFPTIRHIGSRTVISVRI